jgi:hypothetical protein
MYHVRRSGTFAHGLPTPAESSSNFFPVSSVLCGHDHGGVRRITRDKGTRIACRSR